MGEEGAESECRDARLNGFNEPPFALIEERPCDVAYGCEVTPLFLVVRRAVGRLRDTALVVLHHLQLLQRPNASRR